MSHNAFEARARAFEEDYFRRKEVQLVEKLKAVFHRQRSAEQIRQETGITDPVVVDRLVALGLNGELMAAFKLFPLIEVAWADGHVDKAEIHAVLEAAEKNGIVQGSQAYAMLKNSLSDKPRLDGRKAWFAFAAELRRTLSEKELATFRQDLLAFARRVAEASGGILGIVLTVSSDEKRVLDAIEKALSPDA